MHIGKSRTDRVSLIVQPGLKAIPGQSPVSVGVPYGSRARLIILYLQTEAIRTGSREIELGRSLHAWLKRLEIPIGGKSMKDVRDQAERISRCRLTFQISTAGRSGLVNQNILDSAMFVSDDNTQGDLFIETARLSEGFFEQLQKHPVPIEEAAVKQIANNSMALDVYVWLSYRLHSLKEAEADFLEGPPCPVRAWNYPHGPLQAALPGNPGIGDLQSIRMPMSRSTALRASS